jgi:hypothetical protein
MKPNHIIMKTHLLMPVFIFFLSLIACNHKQQEQLNNGTSELTLEAPTYDRKVQFAAAELKADEEIPEENRSAEAAMAIQQPHAQKKIIKDGSISIKATDIHVSKKSINDMLKNFSAYYEKEDLQNDDQRISHNLKIRVPAANFEKLIEALENGKDEITGKSIQARDVTEEYVDIETRLVNKREYLKRYRELIAKATTVKDILAIEENIRTLQEEIESKEGRLKYLQDQFSYSTLEIYLFKDKEFVYKPQQQDKFAERVKKSLSNGWTSTVDLVLWTINIWPFIIILLIALGGIKRMRKNRSAK